MTITLQRPPILHLLTTSRPSDIAGLIVPFVVDSVDGVSGTRSGSDMVVEGHEVVQPFVADGNPASSVVGPTLGVRVGTALLHSHPDDVLGCTGSTMIGAPRDDGRVGATSFTGKFGCSAAARSCSTSTQVAGVGDRLTSAVALAEPSRIVGARGVLSPSDDDKAVEPLPGKVDQAHAPSYRLNWIRTE